MQSFLEKIWSAGIDQYTTTNRKKHIRILNEMAVIFTVSDTIFMTIFLYLESSQMAVCLLILNIFFFSIPLLNHLRQYRSARLVMVGSLYAGIFFFSSTIGPDSLIDVVYVSVLTVPFAIFDKNEKPILFCCLFASIALYGLSNHTELLTPMIVDNPPVDIRYPITAFIFIMPFLVLNQLKKEQHRYERILESRTVEIEEMNRQLSESKSKLELSFQQLQKSMDEREILLREIHHRVKNNMQIVNSLLNLQSRYTDEPKSQQILKHSQFRINSMAMVHELLYSSGNFSEINCRHYMDMLIHHIISSMSVSKEQISWSLKTPDENMTMEAAIPIGLLVNEIITNSLKHGFKNGRSGSVYLEMFKEGDICVIHIGDNGEGYAGKPDDFKDGSLGMLLIHNLIEQLNGTIKKKDLKGTHYEIRFREPQEEPSGLFASG